MKENARDQVVFDKEKVTLLFLERPVSMSIAWTEISSLDAIAANVPQGVLRVLALSFENGEGLEIHEDSLGFGELMDELCHRFELSAEVRKNITSVAPGSPIHVKIAP